MKLLSYSVKGQTVVGILEGESIQRVDGPDMLSLIKAGSRAAPAGRRDVLAEVRILPPLRPGKILAIGRNYVEHARELNNEVPAEPLVFAIMPSAVIGAGDEIEWEGDLTAQVDWEGELAVIMGKTARRVSREDALDYVFGYTVANDVSARDLQTRDKQWTRAKGLDTFCPLGPCIVTADEIADPQNLHIVTTVNGVEKQNSSTANMIFNARVLIEFLSRAFTLNPGDMILTGTPSGVGKAADPPQFLGDGDVVSVEIAGIGKLTNQCRVL
ncbi:MAG: fumarylacetoacetate hydrolase family protein [Chloroflexota bacterium]|nr:fumarylacetoacetate hydrolase family protein [Chloroflexota bacterium]